MLTGLRMSMNTTSMLLKWVVKQLFMIETLLGGIMNDSINKKDMQNILLD